MGKLVGLESVDMGYGVWVSWFGCRLLRLRGCVSSGETMCWCCWVGGVCVCGFVGGGLVAGC